jgi:glyoxylase-like metal-dependent hydrolase (beta-lactamase superfamily II)
MKRIILAVVAIVLLPVLIIGGNMVLTFSALAPPPDGTKDISAGVTLVNDGFAVFYLLTGSDGAALVDCGDDAAGKVILGELKRKSLTPDDVKAIFLTHGHPDHIASCHLFPKAEVYAFAGDVPLAAGQAHSKGLVPRLFDTPVEKQIKVTKTLADGETVTFGDRQVTAFAMPGHTVGSASYLTGGVLMMGDNAGIGKDGVLRPAMSLFSDDQDENRRSLRTLAAKLEARRGEVTLMAYGHSGTSDGLRALADFTR